MNRIIILALAIAVSQPVLAQRKKKGEEDERRVPALRVLSMDKQLQVDSGSFVYTLPRTVFRLNVQVERDIYMPGPYAAYAEKYLGIAKVQTVSKIRYTIKGCKVDAYSESDPRHIYMVQVGDNSLRFDFLKMTKDGLMMVVDNFSLQGNGKVNGFAAQSSIPTFTNVGVESMFREVKAQAVAADTAEAEEEVEPVSIVTATVGTQPKTAEERAAEAAHFLLNLRKRKYELLTGDIDAVFNSDEALKVAIAELKQLERDYLALFVGKHSKARSTFYYDVTPTDVIDSYPVFKFSEENGVQNLDGQGRVITLDIQPEDKYAAAKISPAPKDDFAFKMRLPDIAQVRLLDGKDEMYKGRYKVYQNGKVVNVRLENFLEK